jgi:hypothetical protein
MPWQKHTRLMTDEQFADGTTIDGNRIDRAMEDTVSRFNNLELRDVERRLMPCHYVSGFTPQSPTNTSSFIAVIVSGGTGYSAAAGVAVTGGSGAGMEVDILTVALGVITGVNVSTQGSGYAAGDVVTVDVPDTNATLRLYVSTLHHWPWLKTFNYDDEVLTGTGVPDNFLNPHRVKSIEVDGIVNKESVAASWPLGAQYAWTSEWFFGRPVILDTINLMAILDNTGTSTTEYKPFASSTPFSWPGRYLPANKQSGDDHKDMQIIVQVADPFDKRQRARDAIEVSKHTFAINHNAVSHINLGAPGSDMTPVYPTLNSLAGAAVQIKELNIPVHQNAIVRVSIVIPQYDAGTPHGFWGTEPWNKMIPTLVMTTLEEIE